MQVQHRPQDLFAKRALLGDSLRLVQLSPHRVSVKHADLGNTRKLLGLLSARLAPPVNSLRLGKRRSQTMCANLALEARTPMQVQHRPQDLFAKRALLGDSLRLVQLSPHRVS